MTGVKPEEATILRAVARAHLKTGVPIALHSHPANQVGKQQLAILKEEGVDLRRVKMDHSNDTTDVEYLIWILEQGCYLGLDRYPGSATRVSSQARTKTMKALIDAGYADRLCPSHDRSILHLFGSDQTVQDRLKLNPHGYLYIKNVAFAQLREMGVSEEILNTLCVNGPRNFFEGI